MTIGHGLLPLHLTRRAFLTGTATGLGAVALSTLLDRQQAAAAGRPTAKARPPPPPRAAGGAWSIRCTIRPGPNALYG